MAVIRIPLYLKMLIFLFKLISQAMHCNWVGNELQAVGAWPGLSIGRQSWPVCGWNPMGWDVKAIQCPLFAHACPGDPVWFTSPHTSRGVVWVLSTSPGACKHTLFGLKQRTIKMRSICVGQAAELLAGMAFENGNAKWGKSSEKALPRIGLDKGRIG